MRVKDKLIKQKQSATDRQQNLKHADSTPLLMRLERQYLFTQPHNQQNTVNNPNAGNNHGPSKQLKISKDNGTTSNITNKCISNNRMRQKQQQNLPTQNSINADQHNIYYNTRQNKQNKQIMINSVPTSAYNCLITSQSDNMRNSKKIIKIDNYENKKFRTQNGYIPEMTKSRYEAPPSDNSSLDDNIYTSQQRLEMKSRGKKCRNEDKDAMVCNTDRPLTFGLINKHQHDQLSDNKNTKISQQYKQDLKLKNEVLDEINQLKLRRSQQTLYGSKDYSQQQGQFMSEIPRCANHHNKKAKYRLITDYQQRDQQMIYCSKCAINLLQQGFKVQQLNKKAEQNHLSMYMSSGGTNKHTKNSSNMANSIGNSNKQLLLNSNKNTHIIRSTASSSSITSSSRLQQMRNFQQKLSTIQDRLYKTIRECDDSHTSKQQQIDGDIEQTQRVYCYLLDTLQQMKDLDMNLLRQIKQQKQAQYANNGKNLEVELANISEMKKQIKQYRNKFIVMKQSQFQFLLSSFTNKVHSYGSKTIQQQQQMFDYRKCEISEKVDRIVQSLWDYGRQIEANEHSVVQSSIRKQLKTNMNAENIENQSYGPKKLQDQFMCQQIKRPFRTLFQDEGDDTADNQQRYQQTNMNVCMKKSRKTGQLMRKSKNNYPYGHNQYDSHTCQQKNQCYYANFMNLTDDNGSPSFKK